MQPDTQPNTRVGTSIRTAQLHWWIAIGVILALAISLHSRSDPTTRLTARTMGGSAGVSRFQEPIHSIPGFSAGVTPFDLLIFAFAFAAIAHRIINGRIAFSRRAANLTLACVVPIALGVAVGIIHGTHSPFSDWQNLFTGALFALALWSTVLRSEEGSFRFVQLFVAITTIYAGYALSKFAAGGGDVAFYGRTTLGNHAALEYVVAATALSLAMLRARRSQWLWYLAIPINTLVVMLSFRRYAWIEIAIVVVLFVLVADRTARKRYLTALLALMAIAAVGIALTASTLHWSDRLASLDPRTTKQSNALASTNAGHFNDILDAMDQVRAHPIVGLGVGVPWNAPRTLGWRITTGMVHNGPMFVWIKFGILGLLMTGFVYWLTFKRIWKRRHGVGYSDIAAVGVGAFLFANLMISLTVYEWPFAAPEWALLVFVLIAAAFPVRNAE